MQLQFTKMHGAGNDVIVFDAPRDGSLPTPEQWRALSDRHKGIGFDQAMVIEPPRRAGTQAYYRIFNADGGEVEQCGNGVRCVASFLLRRGDAKNGEILLDSPAGLIKARIHTPELVSVDMGPPNFDPNAVVRDPWGTLTFRVVDDNRARIDWDAIEARYGDGGQDLVRLSSLRGHACTP